MAKVSKVDTCMICDSVPCVCGKPTKLTVQKSAKPPKPEASAPAPKPRVIVRPVIKKLAVPHISRLTDDDLVEIAALRALEPIMSDGAREEFHSQLSSPASRAERVAFWKRRRDDKASQTDTAGG
jgi:hypothetical protein